MIRSMIDIWRYERFMPEGRSHNHNGHVQGGSNADNILADAYFKKLDTDNLVSWTDGYAAMRTNAELQPYNNFDFNDPTGSTKEGRSALDDWKKYGYVSTNYGRSVSKTAEYSLNDFALLQVAKGEAPDEVTKYLNRSTGWQRMWKKDATSHNLTGFLAPLQPKGTALDGYDPYDMVTLIKFMGGPEQFGKRLDTSFVPGLGRQEQGNNGISSIIYNPCNEPSFITLFLYSGRV